MSRSSFFTIVGLAFLLSVNASSQSFSSGFVLENVSKEPLEGVSVFYDGTSIGTITDENGYFEITADKLINSSLVISYVGFESQIFPGNKKGAFGNILLKEKVVELNEVILRPDTWSREKKLNIFKREFLGKTQAALMCRIKNEEAIRLYYNKEKNTLYAFAEVPIQVTNGYLGYHITYNLHDFEVQFENDANRMRFPRSTYTAGTVFFSERNKNRTKKKHLKNRRKIYFGSVLHFMRSLAKKRLKEENFKMFKSKFQIAPYSEFHIKEREYLTEVKQLSKSLAILYDDTFQSSIEIKGDNFFIDAYGNHAPPQNVYFGGVMGMQRVANMLPLNYDSSK